MAEHHGVSDVYRGKCYRREVQTRGAVTSHSKCAVLGRSFVGLGWDREHWLTTLV
jgi:hypothetical protein